MGFLDSCSGASGKDTRFLLGKSEDLFRDLPSPKRDMLKPWCR